MSFPDENLTKCTLLVQRSPEALIGYYTMLFPEFGNIFKLDRKKAEIGKYLVIQKYEMVYVLK